MPNIEKTDIVVRSIAFGGGDETFDDDVVTFAGADTLAAGTILARDSVSLKYVIFVAGGSTNENGIPKAVLMHELVATGAGDRPARVMVEGKVRKAALVIDADGDDSNITKAVRDQLRDYGIKVVEPSQLDQLDN